MLEYEMVRELALKAIEGKPAGYCYPVGKACTYTLPSKVKPGGIVAGCIVGDVMHRGGILTLDQMLDFDEAIIEEFHDQTGVGSSAVWSLIKNFKLELEPKAFIFLLTLQREQDVSATWRDAYVFAVRVANLPGVVERFLEDSPENFDPYAHYDEDEI